ncbi:UpxY family transcription antiterminator [Flavobacterium sp.]|uniref:UpxY family transcription antiterminator n=1 Tax=Flavobacterium sp. TaxID=239 RepID=UPI003F6A2023
MNSNLNWFVLYTKPQQELKVLEQLRKINIEAYCPTIEEVRQWSDRKKKVTVPLIKSYVFVRIDTKHRQDVFNVSGVVRYLFWLGKPAIVYDKEIEYLKKSLEKSYTSIKLDCLKTGNRMLVTSGPFMDNEGTIVKLGSKYITIEMEQLGLLVTLVR